MESIGIRNLRGESLRENALKGRPLAITSSGALIGVIIPVAAAWVEHLIDYNWSHVRQSIAEGEQAMNDGTPMITVDNVASTEGAEDPLEQPRATPERLALPLAAAMIGGTLTQTPESKEILDRLQAALNPGRQEDRPTGSSVITVRVGDLTARMIEKAGADGQTLAVTHERELVGMVIPVTPRLVEFLIEQNMSRVLYNVGLGEKQIRTPEKITTLDEVLSQASGDKKTHTGHR